MFAIYFTIMGTILEWFNKLDPNFIMLIGAIQALVIGHSIKEDYFATKAKENEPKAPVVVDQGGDNGSTK